MINTIVEFIAAHTVESSYIVESVKFRSWEVYTIVVWSASPI